MISLDSIVEVNKIKTHPHRPICFANGEATCCSLRDAIFFCRSSLSPYATFRGLLCTGGTDVSMIMSFSPGKQPHPEDTSLYSSRIASAPACCMSISKCMSLVSPSTDDDHDITGLSRAGDVSGCG